MPTLLRTYSPAWWAPEGWGSLGGEERLEGEQDLGAKAGWRSRTVWWRTCLLTPISWKWPTVEWEGPRCPATQHCLRPPGFRGGGSLCACCSQRQLTVHRGPFVLAASSARRAAGNRAHSPHPLLRPPVIRQCHSRLARKPLAHREGARNRLPGLM